MKRVNIIHNNIHEMFFKSMDMKVKPEEILLVTLLGVGGFLMAELIVNQLMLAGALQRFIVRIVFQIQFITLIYLFFDSRDNARRIQMIHKRHERTRKIKRNIHFVRIKNKKGYGN